MVFHSVPKPVQLLFPKRKWEGDGTEKQIYLTFDDGPVHGVTDYVLDQLEKRGQKASFFVVGDNVRKHPELAKDVMLAGHQIGNHTFNHLNGFKTSDSTYVDNFRKGEEVIQDVLGIKTKHFRPPYGLMKSSQAKTILESHQIVMWNVLSGDYSKTISANQILSTIKKLNRPGSILLFHDQQKTKSILPQFLPDFLDYIKEEGYKTSLL